ncbi:MAG TPA: NAD(P)-dependent oxidoreductase [Devosia sp.]|nr:NAD(P)-dependent oxidoreductase [Devosia sp.]
MRILVTGATGKVGMRFIARLMDDPRYAHARVRALCHNRVLPETDRLEILRGSIADPAVAKAAAEGVTHIFHMATVKEDAEHAMAVSVGGLFNLLEAFRQSPDALQFILIGGDCVVGHCFVAYGEPITEASPRRAYPGVYALSKVIEEEMLEQFGIQYGLNWTTLRAPWIMEKDDFKFALSFGDDQFGGPLWNTLLTDEQIARYRAANDVPILIASDGRPLRRNFVHVDDLAEAMIAAIDHPAARQQLFHICMTDPVDYGVVAAYLARTRGLNGVEIHSPFHSNHLDNAKARQLLGWKPLYNTEALVESAFGYERARGDVRKVWYVG